MIDIPLSTDEKASLFMQFFSEEAEEIICIETGTGTGKTLYARSEKWQKTMGIDYPFESTMQNFLLSFSSDSMTERLISSVNLHTISENLEKHSPYKVYFTVQDSENPFRLKKASFYKMAADKIWLIIQDITEDVDNVSDILQDLNRAFEKTSHELERKNSFLNLMSRNIRMPLYSIMGLTQIAEEHLGGNTALDAYLHKISMSGTYMNETIDEILELRRVAYREIVLSPQPIRLQDFLQHIEQIISPYCQDKQLLFSLHSDIGQESVVNTDLYAMQQILINLLQSAMNYTLKGGRIQLNAHELIQEKDTLTVEFSVNCMGIVMDQERIKEIFQPYDFLLRKMDEDIGSLDIALIILKRYALAMGTDTLMAEMDESKGLKLALTLTLELSDDTKAWNEEAIEKVLPRLKGRKVLVVDDNDTNLEVSEKILTSKGIRVVTAPNGQEALELYQREQGQFDCIIMDIIMPVMDGLEATRQIRSLEDTPSAKTVPIIAMTANAFRENFEESFQAGMNAHLVKPISSERLFRTMASVLPEQNEK